MNIISRIRKSISFRIERRFKMKYKTVFEKAAKFDHVISHRSYPFEGDGLATRHNHDFISEPIFAKAFREADPYLLNPKMYWRTYVVCWAARRALSLPGDFVECGVYKAGFARAVTTYTDFINIDSKNYYLFDTFNGLNPQISTKEEMDREESIGRYDDDCFELVSKAFEDYNNIHIIKGSVPGTLRQAEINEVAFLSMDMNNIHAEQKAMEYFWPKLAKGAIIVIDDYGWRGYEGQKVMHDKFAKSRKREILTLPTGQGLLLK